MFECLLTTNHYQRTLPYVTNDTLHRDLNVSYVRDEIKKLSRKYADRLEQHSGILAIDLMSKAETMQIKEKTTSRLVYINYNL